MTPDEFISHIQNNVTPCPPLHEIQAYTMYLCHTATDRFWCEHRGYVNPQDLKLYVQQYLKGIAGITVVWWNSQGKCPLLDHWMPERSNVNVGPSGGVPERPERASS